MSEVNWRYLGEVGYEGDKVIITDSENFPKFYVNIKQEDIQLISDMGIKIT